MEELLLVDEAFEDLFEAVPKPPAWVIEGLLPAGLTFMAAPPKSYKSTFTMAMSMMIAGFVCRVLPKDMRGVPDKGPVLIWSAEADAGELRHMVEQGMGANGRADGSILVARKPWEYRLDQDDGQRQMLAWLNEKRPRLAIMDPMRNFHTLEEKDSGEMIRMLGPLRQWAVDNYASFLVVHHTRKIEDEGRTYRPTDMRGSSALFGMADGILMMTPNLQRPLRVIVDATFKRAPAWKREIDLAVFNNAGTDGGEVIPDITLQVLRSVQHGYGTAEEIQEHLGLAERETKRRLEWLAERQYIQQHRRRWTAEEKADE